MNASKSTTKRRGIFEKVPGSGIWWIQYFDASGRRRREKAGLLGHAQKLLDKRRTERLQGKKLPETLRAKPITFGELIDDALEHSKAANGERSTTELKLKYETLRPTLGTRPATEITKQEIVRWLTSTAEQRGWAPATMYRWQAAFSLAFRVGIENDKIDRNPAARIRSKPEDNGRTRFLSGEEEQAIRAILAAKYPERVPAFDLSLHTGMRSSEQFSLQWTQIDWDRRILILYRTKYGKPRHIPLNAVSVAALQSLKERNGKSPWVFVNGDGEKLRGHRDWFDPALAESGVQDYTWHCNRHTFASRLVMAGVDLRTVGDLLGHRTPSMTWRYSHLAPSHKQNAVDWLVTSSKATKNKTATRTATGDLLVMRAANG
jgi:integrase